MGQLVNVGNNAIQESDAEAQLTPSKDYLKSMRFLTSQCEACKSGEVLPNQFCLYDGSDIEEALGKDIDAVIITQRWIGIDNRDDDAEIHIAKTADEVIEDESFKALVDEFKAMAPGETGILFGPEYLLWLPEKEIFVGWLLSSKSQKRERKAKKEILQSGQGITLSPKAIKTSKHSWYIATVAKNDMIDNLPSDEAIQTALDLFFAKPEKAEKAEVEDSDRE